MISPETGDAESKMRRNLGLDGASTNGTATSLANDPLKVARQAIRSQVTAREYTERQLAQAQGAIQDLRTRIRHVHQEREAAVNAAQAAMAARDTAERNMRAADASLATERATRGRTEGMLRDAQATILDLREKLAATNQGLRDVRAELEAERLTRQNENDAVITVPEVATPIVRECGLPVVRRPVGRQRRTAVTETVQTMITPSEKPLAIREDVVPPSVSADPPVVRRPVGRPRKIMVVEPILTRVTPSKNPKASAERVTTKTPKIALKNRQPGADNQEPVQWWVEGWKGR